MQGYKLQTQRPKYENNDYDTFQMTDKQRYLLEQNNPREDNTQQRIIQNKQQNQIDKFSGFNNQDQETSTLSQTIQRQSQNNYYDRDSQYNASQLQYDNGSQIQNLINYYQQDQNGYTNQSSQQDYGTENDDQYNNNDEYEEQGDEQQDDEQDDDAEQREDDENYQQEEYDGQYQEEEGYDDYSQIQRNDQESNSRFPINAKSGYQAEVNQNQQLPINRANEYSYQGGDQQNDRRKIQEPQKQQNRGGVQKQERIISHDDRDNDFLIKMKIQEQMKKYDQSKQTRETFEEQQKNLVKQKVWEQLFSQKQDLPLKPDPKQSKQSNHVQKKQRQDNDSYQLPNTTSLIKNIDQTISQVQQNPTSNPSLSVTNQYINNFILNQTASTQQAIQTSKEEQSQKSNKVFGKQFIENKIQKQSIISDDNFQDKFQSQLFQLSQKILNNQIQLEYQDSLQQSNLSKLKVDDIKQENYEPTFDPQQYQGIVQPLQQQSNLSSSNRQEVSKFDYDPSYREKSTENIENSGKYDFSNTQQFQEKFFEGKIPQVTQIKSEQFPDNESDDDMDDLNNRQSDVYLDGIKEFGSKLIINGTKKLQLIQEVQESQCKIDQTDQNWNPKQSSLEDYSRDNQTHQYNDEEQDELQNKFIQYDVGLSDSDNDEPFKLKDFEALKKKKLEVMERAKLDRQIKKTQEEEHINEYEIPTPKNQKSTPTNKRSPLMPSAQGRNKIFDEKEQIKMLVDQKQKSQSKLNTGNIFKDNFTFNDKPTIPQLPKQVKSLEEVTIPKQRQKKEPTQQQQQQQAQDRPVSGKIIISENKSRNNSSNRVSNNKLDSSQNIISQTLVVKARKSNKQLLKNAIMNVCLAGEPNKKEREFIIAQLEQVQADHFVILLKGQFGRMDFKALYGMNQSDQSPEMLFQSHKSPSVLDPAQVLTYLKYDSGAKEFKPIPGNKSFSYIVDAVKLKK